MAPNTKRVFYVKYLPSAVYSALLAKRPDVQLDKLENDSPDEQIASVLTQAHVYQIGASRQIITPPLQVNTTLLVRTPNLIVASSNGAGYDTIDVDACTEAGIAVVNQSGEAGIAVVNQSGGNKEAVAEHALAMMLTLSKRIVEADRHARTGQTIDRGTYIGRELNGRTVGVLAGTNQLAFWYA
jgi:D-3-phosphoglycerate dehydrogenase